MDQLAEIVFGGSMWLALPISVLAGLLAVFSPCSLPVLPAIVALAAGASGSDPSASRARASIGIALFMAGFSIVFVSLGFLSGWAGSFLLRWEMPLRIVMGLLVVAMGIVFIGVFQPLQRTWRLPIEVQSGYLGAPVLGFVVGLGWTACYGPTLVAIQALGMIEGGWTRGMVLAVAYCVGFGLPMLGIALGLGAMTRVVGAIRRHVRLVNVSGGVLLVLLGAAIASGVWGHLAASLQSLLPWISLV